jgi:hypothetical protein
VDDADRARRALQHGLGDGAEGHVVEAAPAPGAHHEQLGPGRGVKQRRSRCAGQVRAHPGGAKHRLGVRQPAGRIQTRVQKIGPNDPAGSGPRAAGLAL